MPVPRPWPPGSPGGPPLGSASTPRSRGWCVGEKPSLELWPSRGVTAADPRAGHRRGQRRQDQLWGARSFHVKPSSAGGQPAHCRLGWALRVRPCPPLVPQTEASSKRHGRPSLSPGKGSSCSPLSLCPRPAVCSCRDVPVAQTTWAISCTSRGVNRPVPSGPSSDSSHLEGCRQPCRGGQLGRASYWP